ncbi:MAG: C69 family dipeptidase [Myxococcales bacterium]|nr:C69 family dipeptidase [Myxococcales bacterium]
MCDSIVVVEAGETWLAKNSDREPGEAQAVSWVPGAPAPSSRHARRRCTHVSVADRGRRRAVVLSRPSWMWGAEMGVNESGLAVANEAVFTRMPVAQQGLTGMDLLRLALERADTAREGVAVITGLLREHPQGGRMGHRSEGFRYHSSFLLADGREAWLLETAGWLWAARRIEGPYSSSNLLGIGRDHDLLHPQTMAHARAQGWWRGRGALDFAAAFGDPLMAIGTGGARRRTCTLELASRAGDRFATLAAALRSHGGRHPSAGLRLEMPCAHASWPMPRAAGQTTGSMITRAGPSPRVWMTGTSSPCLSVFKPVAVDRPSTGAHAEAGEQPDDGLWWRHERFHREVLGDYESRVEVGAQGRARLEAEGRELDEPDGFAALWEAHHQALPQWRAEAARSGRARRRPFERFWARQSRRDGLVPSVEPPMSRSPPAMSTT